MATRSNPQNQTKQPLSNEDTTTRELDEKDLYISNLETEVLLLKAAVTKLKSELGGFRARSATKTLVEGDLGHADSSAYGVNAENTASSGPFATKSLPRDSSRKRLREDATEENLDNNVVNKISNNEVRLETANHAASDDSNHTSTKRLKKRIVGGNNRSFDTSLTPGPDSSPGPPQCFPSALPHRKTPFQIIAGTDERCEMLEPEDQMITTTHQDTTILKFIWKGNRRPRNVFIVKKIGDQASEELLVKIYKYLLDVYKIETYVEPSVYAKLHSCYPELKTYDESSNLYGSVHKYIDFAISIGGDGTILWLARIFNGPIPPVISFAMGSLGFLTPFSPNSYQETLSKFILHGGFISMRSRISARIIKNNEKADNYKAKNNMMEAIQFQALNEAVIDRGPSSVLSNLLCYYNDKLLTRVQADGLIVATPTGSTAYSLSAGGAIVHPAVPSMLLTPICPHTLSFRPVILPDSATLKIKVPTNSRASAWVAFDGRDRCELRLGDELELWISPYPLPAVTKLGERGDWLASLTGGLQWNVRGVQKPIT
eukprot:g1626.t1